ncbi:MAG: SseB family protein [Nocardioides sp.]|uniref:SseB family protein n=1 Tax=Nocardioides sp. TaxID=35761 RepID=UPI003EFBE7C3
MDKVIPDPGFAGDDGTSDATVLEVLAAHRAGARSSAEVLTVLEQTRLLVPVVAVLGEVEYDENGLKREKTSDMAAVLVQGADGRRALLAFTGMDTMKAWNPEARPVPVPARTAATSAIQDGAAALLVNIAGPASYVLQGEDLTGFASGWTLARVGEQTVWVATPAAEEGSPGASCDGHGH